MLLRCSAFDKWSQLHISRGVTEVTFTVEGCQSPGPRISSCRSPECVPVDGVASWVRLHNGNRVHVSRLSRLLGRTEYATCNELDSNTLSRRHATENAACEGYLIVERAITHQGARAGLTLLFPEPSRDVPPSRSSAAHSFLVLPGWHPLSRVPPSGLDTDGFGPICFRAASFVPR